MAPREDTAGLPAAHDSLTRAHCGQAPRPRYLFETGTPALLPAHEAAIGARHVREAQVLAMARAQVEVPAGHEPAGGPCG